MGGGRGLGAGPWGSDFTSAAGFGVDAVTG